ncbi:MAG: M1 family metallopeptidase [Kofleriaceae bacterium]|nr:M1 family metallopeptidase [Kofleriaceae bacterium]
MRTDRLVVLALVAGACGSRSEVAQIPTAAVRTVTDDTSPIGRLDERAFPTSYELALEVDPRKDGYSGEVAITVVATRPQRVIWLHGRDLVIDRATIATADGAVQTGRVVADERTEHTQGQGELLGIGVDNPVEGRILVHIAYHAKYREKEGLMRAATEAKLVFTDLEPNDARALLPCFDDPRFKVGWTVSVTAPEGMGVYANYPEQKRTKVDGGRVRVAFQPTRPLPSYLVAVAVGELEVVPVSTENGVPIQLLLPGKNIAPFTTIIQNATPKLLADLVTVFNDPVPFPKLDMLVVPMDAGRGGMENPGLTTLGAHMVLVDPTLPPERARPRIEDAVHVVAHELAHLWIGDLVTIDNWGDLWLQEGGATWFGIRAARTYLGTKWVPPFNRDVIDQRLKDGARPPIRTRIGKLGDANAMFRTETYAGGAAVFDALEAWLGEDAITHAMADLMKSHAATTITFDDFRAAVQKRAGIMPDDLKDSLVAMLDATRMPSVTARCMAGAIEVTVDPPVPTPVCVERDGAPRACAVVREGQATLGTAPACPTWLLTNPGGGAPYVRTWVANTLAPVLLHAPLVGRDEAAMLSELRTRLLLGGFETLSLGDQVVAAAWLASNADVSPMIGWRSVELLDRLERAAPDAKARAALLARVQAVTAKRAPAFPAPGGTVATSPLAVWLARRGDVAMRASAVALAKDLVAAAASSSTNADLLVARASIADARQFRALTAALFAQPKRSPSMLRALASFQFSKVGTQLGALLKDKRLTARDVETVIIEALRNPALHADLVALAAVRPDISPYVRADVGRALCDQAAAKTILDGIQDEIGQEQRTRLLQEVDRCIATRKAWDVK